MTKRFSYVLIGVLLVAGFVLGGPNELRDYDQAVAKAQTEGKPILVYLHSPG